MKKLLVLVAFISTFTLANADVIKVPVSQQGESERRAELPKRGIHHDTLIEQWGEPLSRSGPVGTPPIYRMDYQDFFVVLEGKWVIRSVLKAKPVEE